MKKIAALTAIVCAVLVSQASAQQVVRVHPYYIPPTPVKIYVKVGDVHMQSGEKSHTVTGHEISVEGAGDANTAFVTAVKGVVIMHRERAAEVQNGFNHVFRDTAPTLELPPTPAFTPPVVYAPPAPAPQVNRCVHCGRDGHQVVLVWVENTHWVCADHRVGNGFADCQGHTWLWDSNRRLWYDP